MQLWTEFQRLIFEALQWIYSIVGDWGMAIIVLTVAFRIILMPLTIKQTKSMLELQRIQPKIKELQAKYKDDPTKLQEETMKFYQENKVNPFGGCLPALLQSPIFFALYGVLRGTQGNRPAGMMIQHLNEIGQKGTFYNIITDISITPAAAWGQGVVYAIPYVLLVLIFGLSVWLPQALMPGEKQQKMIGLVMAVVMLTFGWSAPAGVLLYWDASSIWGLAQQQIIMGISKRRVAAEEAAAAEQLELEKAEKEAKRAAVAAKKPSNKKKSKR
ncbi:MAG: YidC/Oxa1 family membrane protein insertase [Coriobacteriia bacterium]